MGIVADGHQKQRQPEKCDNCSYETADLREVKNTRYRAPYPDTEDKYHFCTVCDSTYLGRATLYPNAFKDPLLAQSLAQVVNIILDEIRNMK